MHKPVPNHHFHQGKKAFESEEWDEAIRAFLASIEEDPHRAESYIALMKTYEAAAEESEDPALFEQAVMTCRRARKLRLDAKQRAIVDEAADRVSDKLRELREEK